MDTPSGLKNNGVICWLNSVIQALLSSRIFCSSFGELSDESNTYQEFRTLIKKINNKEDISISSISILKALIYDLKRQQKSIDIGCGTNFVAKYYDHVHGVDPYFPEYRNNSLTPDWFIHNWQKWPLCFAINSMHFVPQSEIVNNINKISGLLTNKGKAIVTINRKMINEFTGQSYNSEELFDKLKTCNNLKHMLWFDNPKHADIDGNVWLYLEK